MRAATTPSSWARRSGVRLTFGEAVKVTGTPTLAIDMDPAEWGTKSAAYEGATGTAVLSLTFAHEVVEPNLSRPGIAVLANTLTLNGEDDPRSAATETAAALGHAGLGHDAAHKVDWRPALSVADARAREGVDEAVAFEVSLDRAFTSAEHRVTVDYATADGTARGGRGLHGDERFAHLRRGRAGEDGVGADPRRRPRRGARDVQPAALEPRGGAREATSRRRGRSRTRTRCRRRGSRGSGARWPSRWWAACRPGWRRRARPVRRRRWAARRCRRGRRARGPRRDRARSLRMTTRPPLRASAGTRHRGATRSGWRSGWRAPTGGTTRRARRTGA